MNKKFKPLKIHPHWRAEDIVVKNNTPDTFSNSIETPQALIILYQSPLGYRKLLLPSEVLDEQEI